MAQRVLLLLSLVVGVLGVGGAAGCTKAGAGKPAQQPDGSYRLECNSPLSDCLQRAEQLCEKQGYVLAEARDVHEVLGHEQGQSQVEVHRSEALVYCGSSSAPPPRAMVEVKGDPVTRPKRARPSDDPNPYPEAGGHEPTGSCVPGATQACVGPGGCSGGQACAADGSRYEACDCGAAKPSPSEPPKN